MFPPHPARSARSGPDHGPENRRLPPILRRAWYGLNQAFRRRIAHLRLTPDQYTVLRILQEGDPQGMTQSQLTRTMTSDPNTIASLLERMESAGLLRRVPHKLDRRARLIRLRSPGQRKYTHAKTIALALQQDVLEVLPVKERQRFLKNLAQVADACASRAAQKLPG